VDPVKLQLIDSDYACRRCHKRMVVDAGQHESEGDLEVVHTCLSCDWSSTQRPERDRTSEGPSLSMAELRDKVRAGRPMPPPAAIQAILEEQS
jgi:hypothetical protein